MGNTKKTLTLSQYKEEFKHDLDFERKADGDYWETREGEWDECVRDEFRTYCEDNGYQAVFD